MKAPDSPDEIQEVDLLRGRSVTSSLAGAFGRKVRETRLTSILGYLIAQEPEKFCEFFRFDGRAINVRLEMDHENDRSDIYVETNLGTGVIEAKISPIDPIYQASKYPARWHVLLTNYVPLRTKRRPNFAYISWGELMDKVLVRLSKSTKCSTRFVSRDLIAYLKESNMVHKKDPVEIYAREINEEYTLALFLKGRMYGCNYEKGSRLIEALYFAPHFGQKIASEYPGVRVGISYIARVESVEPVGSRKDLIKVTQRVRSKKWLNSHKDLLTPILREWDWENVQRCFLFLGPPMLAFNPPILKENLQRGSGFLSKRFHTFEDFFRAWGC